MLTRGEEGRTASPTSSETLRPPSLSRLLRTERDYRLYWSGQMLASTGSWLLQSVLAYVVAVRFVSPTASGLVAFCSLAPVVLVALYGGVLADRASRRAVLRGTAAAQAVCAIASACWWPVTAGPSPACAPWRRGPA